MSRNELVENESTKPAGRMKDSERVESGDVTPNLTIFGEHWLWPRLFKRDSEDEHAAFSFSRYEVDRDNFLGREGIVPGRLKESSLAMCVCV